METPSNQNGNSGQPTMARKKQLSAFVTGATGFLGKHLCEQLLARNIAVSILYRSEESLNTFPAEMQKRMRFVNGDLFDDLELEEAIKAVDVVFHVAAKVSFAPNDKTELFKVNVEGTANIVNLCLESKKPLVHFSSIAAIGRDKEKPHITEQTKWEHSSLNSDYALSKHLGEMEVWRGIAEGLNAVILNPSIIIGHSDWTKGSSQLFKRVYDGQSFYPIGTTGFVDVEDVAKAAILLYDNAVWNQRFILNADNLSWKSFFEKVAKAFKVKAPSKKASPQMANIYWRWEWLRSKLTGKKPLVTRQTAHSSSATFYYNGSLIEKTIDFQYKKLDDSICDICEKYAVKNV